MQNPQEAAAIRKGEWRGNGSPSGCGGGAWLYDKPHTVGSSMAVRSTWGWLEDLACFGAWAYPVPWQGSLEIGKWRRGYPDKLPLPLARILALWALVTQYGCGRAFSSAACPVCGSENCCLRPCPALAGGKALEQSSWWLDTADAFQSA